MADELEDQMVSPDASSAAPAPIQSSWPTATGPARVDRRTKDLVRRLLPGDIAVIDHRDLDIVATEGLLDAGVAGVVNANKCMSGRYPNPGPLLLAAAGVPVLDAVGTEVIDALDEGETVTIVDDELWAGDRFVGSGRRQDQATFGEMLEAARTNMGEELQLFAENTLSHIQGEVHLLVDDPEVPDVPVDFENRHVLVVVRGVDYRQDLELLRRSGYLKEQRPLMVGVDGGADAIMELGYTPDVIIGDMDSVSERALRSGAALVVHGYTDGRAPGSVLLDQLGLDHAVFASAGTSEDVALLLAFEKGASLIVAVGTHSSMADFLDKGRAGMASTFLVRMKVGPILVDAKGVNRLYDSRVRGRDLIGMILAAIITLVIISLVSEPIRTVWRGLFLSVR